MSHYKNKTCTTQRTVCIYNFRKEHIYKSTVSITHIYLELHSYQYMREHISYVSIRTIYQNLWCSCESMVCQSLSAHANTVCCMVWANDPSLNCLVRIFLNRHLVDFLGITLGIRGIGFLRKAFALIWGLFHGDTCICP